MFARALKGFSAAAIFSLALATPAQASPIALDGSWKTMIDFMSVDEFFTDANHGAPDVASAISFDWTSALNVLFKITDLYVVGDHFRIYDKGVAVADVTNGLQWNQIPGCLDTHDASCHWNDSPDQAWADPAFAKKQIVFAPGDHSITIQVLNIPIAAVSGSPYLNATTAVSAEAIPTPEPASLFLLGSGLTAVAARARRRRQARAV